MIQVVTNSYKDEQHPYENGFIHSRVIEYISHGIETEVFVLNRKKKKKVYYFEGVKVSVGDGEDLKQRLEIYKEATVCVHFLSVDIANTLKKNRTET